MMREKSIIIIIFVSLLLLFSPAFAFAQEEDYTEDITRGTGYYIKIRLDTVNTGMAASRIKGIANMVKETKNQDVITGRFSNNIENIHFDNENNKVGIVKTVLKPDEHMYIDMKYRLIRTEIKKDFNIEDIGSKIPDNIKKYVEPSLWQSDMQKISSKAGELTSSSDSIYNKISSIAKWIRENIRPQKTSGDKPPLWTINKKVGDETDKSSLFVSLVKSVGVPAKVSYYFKYGEEIGSSLSRCQTKLPKVYLPNIGWRVVDIEKREGSLFTLSDDYVFMSNISIESWSEILRIKWVCDNPKWKCYNDKSYLPEFKTDFIGSSLSRKTGLLTSISSSIKDENISVNATVRNVGSEDVEEISVIPIASDNYFTSPTLKSYVEIKPNENKEINFNFEYKKKRKEIPKENIKIITIYNTNWRGYDIKSYSIDKATYQPPPERDSNLRLILLLIVMGVAIAGAAYIAYQLRKEPEKRAIPLPDSW